LAWLQVVLVFISPHCLCPQGSHSDVNTWITVTTNKAGVGCIVLTRDGRRLPMMTKDFETVYAIPPGQEALVNLGTRQPVEIQLQDHRGETVRKGNRWYTVLAKGTPFEGEYSISFGNSYRQENPNTGGWIRLIADSTGIGSRIEWVRNPSLPVSIQDDKGRSFSAIPAKGSYLVGLPVSAGQTAEIRLVKKINGIRIEGEPRSVMASNRNDPNRVSLQGPDSLLARYTWLLPVSVFLGIIIIGSVILWLVLKQVMKVPAIPASLPESKMASTVHDWPNYLRARYPHFIPERKISVGGMGTIFLVQNRQRSGKRGTAVKVLHPQFSQAVCPEALRFLDEAKVISHLGRSRMVPMVYQLTAESPESGAVLWFEMEYLHSFVPLRKIIGGKDKKRLPLQHAQIWCHRLFEAIRVLHKNGVLHRDLSPENIMVDTKRGLLKLIDFGLAKWSGKQYDDSEIRSGHLTQPGEHVGKPKYCSPEQWNEGLHKATEAADWYSVGAMAWEMIFGSTPYRNPDECLSANGRIKFPEQINHSEDDGHLLRFVTALIHYDPEVRIESVRNFQH